MAPPREPDNPDYMRGYELGKENGPDSFQRILNDAFGGVPLPGVDTEAVERGFQDGIEDYEPNN